LSFELPSRISIFTWPSSVPRFNSNFTRNGSQKAIAAMFAHLRHHVRTSDNDALRIPVLQLREACLGGTNMAIREQFVLTSWVKQNVRHIFVFPLFC
jgi:hypothetical protein